MQKTISLFAAVVFFTSYTTAQTLTDIDSNVYNTVIIGSQIWMKENLKVTHYRDGTPIPHFNNDSLWGTATGGARCYYYDDSTAYAPVYGALYNWLAVDDIRKVCPAGWHVPSDHEWNVLERYLDISVDTTVNGATGTDVGGKLKETDTTHWKSPNTGATNSSGFSGLPGGFRGYLGPPNTNFDAMGNYGYWLSATEASSGNAWRRSLDRTNAQIDRGDRPKKNGYSVRCVSDSTVAVKIQENNMGNLIRYYPNPAYGNVFFDVLEIQELELRAYDIFGRLVHQSLLKSGHNEIDISTLKSGIYVIKLSGSGYTFHLKLRVE